MVSESDKNLTDRTHEEEMVIGIAAHVPPSFSSIVTHPDLVRCLITVQSSSQNQSLSGMICSVCGLGTLEYEDTLQNKSWHHHQLLPACSISLLASLELLTFLAGFSSINCHPTTRWTLLVMRHWT